MLEIPAVLESAAAGNNDALRIAYQNGHLEVVERLLLIESVRQEVLRSEDASDDLIAIAQNTENSMRALNLHEHGIINALKTRYKDIFSPEKQSQTIEDLKNFLESEYRKNPVILDNGSEAPLEHTVKLTNGEFVRLFQNPAHTAWRYLFARPNPWMHEGAAFVDVTANGRQASINPKDWELLAHIWLILNDETAELEEGFNLTDLKQTFIITLALMGRAHNYDKDETDDLEKDKPTCSMGVTLRLLNGLTGFAIANNPEIRVLTGQTIADKFQSELINEENSSIYKYINSLTQGELSFITKSLNDYIAEGCDEKNITNQQLDALKKLCPNAQEIESFVARCQEYWGQIRFMLPREYSYQAQNYNSASELIDYLKNNTYKCFCQRILQLLEQKLDRMRQGPVLNQAGSHKRRRDDEDKSDSEPDSNICKRKKGSKWCVLM